MPKTKLALSYESTIMITATPEPVINADVRLGVFKEKTGNSDPLTLDDFVLPAVGGYPKVLLDESGSGPFLQLDGSYVVNLGSLTQNGNAAELPVTLQGWYIIDNTTDENVLYWGYFQEPVVLVSTEQNLQVFPRIRFKPVEGDTDVVVING